MRKQKRTHRSSANGNVRYKVKNWREYNRSLINRGDITLWFSKDVKLFHEQKGPRKVGGQYKYSDGYIEICCTIRKLYGLGLRQTQGMALSLVRLLKKDDIGAPDYTVICRRMKKLKIDIGLTRKIRKGEPLHIAVDSTGLKVYGEGEWKVRQHGWSKHRTWRKIHIGVDTSTGEILCQDLTPNSTDDGAMVESLLEKEGHQLRIEKMMADGAYDKEKVYAVLKKHKIKPVIPPRKGARIKKHGNSKGQKHPRDKALRYIRKHGKQQWKKHHHYHKRNIAETTMYRLKTTLGDRLQSREFKHEQVEMAIACKILNKMTKCGMPVSEKYQPKAA